MSNLSYDDLKVIYAQMKAQNALITVAFTTIISQAGEQAQDAKNALREASVDLLDRTLRDPENPNVKFGHDVDMECLKIVGEFFDKLLP